MTGEQRQIKVLFVDDDPRALASIERLMLEEGAVWEMRFATSGKDALADLEYHGPVDVVVSDLHMPDMDGVALLSDIKDQYPETVRMISSDFRDITEGLRSLQVAHQFLNSPIDPFVLIVAIERTTVMQERVIDTTMRKILGGIDSLPSPPASVVELNRALARPDVSMDEVAHVIESDPAMTAKLLQLVNSAFFGLTHRITNAQHAVNYLGLTTVRNLLTAVEMVRAFLPDTPELSQAAEEIYTHSLAVAEFARTLTSDRSQAHNAFAAGMMHDIGLLAMMRTQPAKYKEVRDAVTEGKPLAECEPEIFGATHASIGAYLLGIWGLPQSLVDAVAHSHDADTLEAKTMSPVHAVYIAEQVLNTLGTAGSSWETAELPGNEYLQALGVADIVTELAGRVKA